jgi:hypothetical protein
MTAVRSALPSAGVCILSATASAFFSGAARHAGGGNATAQRHKHPKNSKDLVMNFIMTRVDLFVRVTEAW